MGLPGIQPSVLLLTCAVLTLCFTLYYAIATRSSSSSSASPALPLPPLSQQCAPCPSSSGHHRGLRSAADDPYTSLPQALVPGPSINRTECPGEPQRPNHFARPLLSDVPALYATLPYVRMTGEDVGDPTCWTAERYAQWKRGALRTFPMTPRTADLLSHVMFSVVTGRVHHRSRADIIMCTYGQQLRYGRLWFHSDAEDELRRLPITGNVQPDSSGQCDHACSERKWVSGLNVTLRLGLSQPGIRWFMVADDDTFIAPKQLAEISALYDHRLPYLIGSVHYNLDELPDRHGLYGGAGFLISRQLAARILPHLAACYDFQYTQSDLFMSRCMVEMAGATLVDRPEMASEPPRYYVEQADDCVEFTRPGISKAATFHYVTPWQEYYYLWMLYLAFSD